MDEIGPLLHTIYGHTLFYCTSQILHFLQTEGLWQPCEERVYPGHFSNSIFSLLVSVSHFSNSHSISNFFITFVRVNCDQ